MTIVATTIYNRAGKGHIWFGSPTKPGYWRSFCGLVEEGGNIDQGGVISTCGNCRKAQRAFERNQKSG